MDAFRTPSLALAKVAVAESLFSSDDELLGDALEIRVDAYESQGQLDKAIGCQVRLVELARADSAHNLGVEFERLGDEAEARRGLITVSKSEWKGQVTETKGMEARVVPMTQKLRRALKDNDHLVGDRILYSEEMAQVTAKVIQKWMARAQRRAKLKANGGFHIMKHTFCSHLAMRGAPALAIQRLAGHKNMQTTLRYMHLAPGETHRVIALLEGQNEITPSTENDELGGEIGETATNVIAFPNHEK
ncbi:MAG: tyrosine-type recombinase/integrase [Myxococcales bacterium]|nr:tyrosine-type recombinase/integrase [Myxococcales bacterium]